MKVAVIAHCRKTLGGGLAQLRASLAEAGITHPLWYEVTKSRKAPKQVRKALRNGADRLLVWGGDGMVQRCLDTLAGSADGSARSVAVGILPAGTGNLFANNLGVPIELEAALSVALGDHCRRLDLGKVNGEHFAVMAGAGFDGHLMGEADRALKRRAGRLAYVWTGLRHVRDGTVPARITVDGQVWFDGPASCVLFGNVGTITGGIEAFDDARPDDGRLDVGVTTAHGAVQWARTLGRMAVGRSADSPFVTVTSGHKIVVRFDARVPYELDGGARDRVRKLKARAVPAAVTVCVPAPRPPDAPAPVPDVAATRSPV
jgi:diacylglycerol kinase (ATP)